MKLFTRDRQTDTGVVKVLASCSELSTRTLLEVSMRNPGYTLVFAGSEAEFLQSARTGAHDIYIIDTSAAQGAGKLSLIRQLASQKRKGKARVVLLVDEKPPEGADRMETFGPLCFMESFFTVDRLMDVLGRAVNMKDTGCRVKGDSKFFNIGYMSIN